MGKNSDLFNGFLCLEQSLQLRGLREEVPKPA